MEEPKGDQATRTDLGEPMIGVFKREGLLVQRNHIVSVLGLEISKDPVLSISEVPHVVQGRRRARCCCFHATTITTFTQKERTLPHV